jgi:Na+/H+ antiporter NhaD/arsenite permease-like protein
LQPQSHFTTQKQVHQANDFNFHPIKEVAILFAGIFTTMMPALDWLQSHAAALGSPTPSFFYWGSDVLSSVLDNAPTYLSFLSMQIGAFISQDSVTTLITYVKAHGVDLAGSASAACGEDIRQAIAALRAHPPNGFDPSTITPEQAQMALLLGNTFFAKCLKAISIGSVFFGANTYIGIGPNFMVKSIADQQKAHTPSFPGYIWRFTVPFMVPMLLIVWLLFWR